MNVTNCFVKHFETSDYTKNAISMQVAPSQ